jgi:hypothetical protein
MILIISNPNLTVDLNVIYRILSNIYYSKLLIEIKFHRTTYSTVTERNRKNSCFFEHDQVPQNLRYRFVPDERGCALNADEERGLAV